MSPTMAQLWILALTTVQINALDSPTKAGREVLILTLAAIQISMQGCISWYIPWPGMDHNDEGMAASSRSSRFPSALGRWGCSYMFMYVFKAQLGQICVPCCTLSSWANHNSDQCTTEEEWFSWWCLFQLCHAVPRPDQAGWQKLAAFRGAQNNPSELS